MWLNNVRASKSRMDVMHCDLSIRAAVSLTVLS